MTPSERIDRPIADLADWRGRTFAGIREAILSADGEIVEKCKWMGSPVWSRDGLIAVANAHKGRVKLTFVYGAGLPDPRGFSTRALKATRDGRSTFSKVMLWTNERSRRSSAPPSDPGTFATLVTATPDERTRVIDTGRPKPSTAPIIPAATSSATRVDHSLLRLEYGGRLLAPILCTAAGGRRLIG